MQLRINQGPPSVAALALILSLVGFLGPVVGEATGDPELVRRPVGEKETTIRAVVEDPPPIESKPPKIGAILLEIAEVARIREDWQGIAAERGLLVEGDSVLVEMRLDHRSSRGLDWHIENLGGRVRHHNVPSLMEVWLPLTAIEKTAGLEGVLLMRPARLVSPTAGSVTSEGVAVLNVNTGVVDYDYHDLGVDGAGVTIANIDAGYRDYAGLQLSGDWPQSTNLQRFEVSGGTITSCDTNPDPCTNYEASDHGAATMEIVFDVAPGADYMTYRTTTVGDWYNALRHAADNGADVVTVSLSAPLDNVGDGGICPPIWSEPCGTIAEAAEYARSQGVLVVNSAGNNRTEHWGGTYDGGRWLQWVSGSRNNESLWCLPNGHTIDISLFWDDWTDPVDHDYDLYLLERVGGSWTIRAYSNYSQNGAPGQTPQEYISYTVTGAAGAGDCPDGTGVFALRVYRYSALSARNLQVFANDFIELEFSTPDRSLGFPADSPDVYAVGAVEVSSPGTLKSYSSEGPVLGPGGSQDSPNPLNPKPNAVSVSDVSTVTYGDTAFGGTSSSAPHTAGIAALFTQARNEKYDTQPVTNNPVGMAKQLSLFALEDPTFSSNFDTSYGNGLVRPRFCNDTVNVIAGEFIMLGLPCNQRGSMTVGDVLGPIVNGDWGMWSWDAANETYDAIHSLPSPETVEMEPGVGYWLWYENDAVVSMQGLVHDRSEPYRLQLVGEDGGLGRPNLLGHTFDFDTAWPDVRVYYQGNDLSLEEAFTFDGGVLRNFAWKPYTTNGYLEWNGTADPPEGTFNSYDGFWVKAWKDCDLGVPVEVEGGPSAERTQRVARTPGWTIGLNATLNGVTASARIGQLQGAEGGWDRFDAELMPSAETHQFYVVVPHDDWGEFAGSYVRDYRGRRRSDVWRFEVRSNTGGSVVLRWAGPRRILKQSIVVDLQTGVTIPAAKLGGNGYEFTMAAGSRAFLWRVR